MARLRQIAVFVLLVALVVVVPMLIQYFQARRLGLVWQGRYTLPLAVGIPVTASAFIDASQVTRTVQARLSTLLVIGVSVAQAGAFAQTVRRYAVGQNGTLAFWNGPWHPPLGTVITCSGFFVAMGLFALFIWGLLGAVASCKTRSEENQELFSEV